MHVDIESHAKWNTAHRWLCRTSCNPCRTSPVPWPGKYGAFLGPDDAHFAIVAPNGRAVEVYDTDKTSGSGAAGPLFSVVLEGGALLPGLGTPVFPGPPTTNVSNLPRGKSGCGTGARRAGRFRWWRGVTSQSWGWRARKLRKEQEEGQGSE